MPVLPFGMACVAAAVDRAGHEFKTVNLMAQEDVIGVSVKNIDDPSVENPRFLLESIKPVLDG